LVNEIRQPSALDDYFFDLWGYRVVPQAVEPDLIDRLNAAIDALPEVGFEEWIGNAQRRDYTPETGLEIHNAVELGGPFEELIDHPGYIEFVRRWAGEKESYVEGLFIDEAILSVRKSGGHHPVHSGGYKGALRGRYNYVDGVFRCGQVNVILALTDVGEGDGATMVIPGSHKSHFRHPNEGNYHRGDRMDHLEGAQPLYLKKGDALLFVDGVMHGGSSRENPGERRVTIYRYGPSWGSTRLGYEYSAELLDRLSPERRAILQPVAPRRPAAKVLTPA
jgi:hypothetical protein